MISITPNAAWKGFSQIYGNKDIIVRYTWFLNEFGKRATKIFLKNLGQNITKIPGTKEYKRKLIIAEMRDKGKRYWFSVVASAKTLDGSKYEAKTSLFEVVARFELADDPVKEILQDMGPWTVDTLPFIPSERQGQIVMKTVDAKIVERTKERNFDNGDKTTSAMVKHGLVYENRDAVYQKLKVVRDFELQAIRLEFGLTKEGQPHWRPSLRWLKKNGLRKLEKDKDLIKVWVDPKFRKYRFRRQVKVKLNQDDLKMMQKFQDKVRV